MKRFVTALLIVVLFLLPVGSSAVESNSIIDCMRNIIGEPSAIKQTMQTDVSACAQFILSNEVMFAGPGGTDADLTAFFHPQGTQWSDTDLWKVYGEILSYLDSHYAAIMTDGYALSRGDCVDNDVCIVIYTESKGYISYYNPFLQQITTTITA